MSYIESSPLKNSTIMLLYFEKDEIQLNPTYQRMGDIWTIEKKQLLIDSVINDYDIPKMYFHILNQEGQTDPVYKYAVIDGRQRLEAIWGFIEGKFALDNEFKYLRDSKINLAGLTYDDIAQNYPKIKVTFDSFILPVIGIETDDEELIEEMFSRLNEAVPLNAAEKRNALGGKMVNKIREVADNELFVRRVSFSNRRFQHREVSARFLLLELNLKDNKKLADTKKAYLDSMAKTYSSVDDSFLQELVNAVTEILNAMCKVFVENDPLLSSQGTMNVYYLLFRMAKILSEEKKITRRKLIDFQEKLRSNRLLAEENYEKSSFELLEYDRLSQQGTNDATNIKERFSILASYIGLSNTEL